MLGALVLCSRSMKTESEQLIERLEALKARQAALRQELTALDAAEQRYAMALDVLRSLHDEPFSAAATREPAVRRRVTSIAEPAAKEDDKDGSLSSMIVRHAFRERDGLTTGEIVAAVQSALPSAKYASIVSVLSRLIHKGGTLRREGKLVFLQKTGESPAATGPSGATELAGSQS